MDPGRSGFFGRSTLFVFWLFILAICAALLIPAIPQYRLLKNIEEELANVQREEVILREKSDQLETESRELGNNPRYLEARARDIFRYHIEGETVIEFKD